MDSSQTHEVQDYPPSDEVARKLLDQYNTIAVVGLSTNPGKPGHTVPKYLKENGYTIIPVNPAAKGEILGEKVYASLSEIPVPVEVVELFRPSGDVPPIVDEAIKIGAKAVWMQEGIINHAAAERARKAGLTVVMDRCMMKIHRGT